MKWVEIIVLRSAGSNRKLLESELTKLIAQADKKNERPEIMVYSRVLIDTDFSIQIINDSDKVENSGSQLGLCLVSALKEFGLVNHSIWIEMPYDP